MCRRSSTSRTRAAVGGPPAAARVRDVELLRHIPPVLRVQLRVAIGRHGGDYRTRTMVPQTGGTLLRLSRERRQAADRIRRKRGRAQRQRLDGRPHPFRLLLDEPPVADRLDRLDGHELQTLRRLELLGRDDQRLYFHAPLAL